MLKTFTTLRTTSGGFAANFRRSIEYEKLTSEKSGIESATSGSVGLIGRTCIVKKQSCSSKQFHNRFRGHSDLVFSKMSCLKPAASGSGLLGNRAHHDNSQPCCSFCVPQEICSTDVRQNMCDDINGSRDTWGGTTACPTEETSKPRRPSANKREKCRFYRL